MSAISVVGEAVLTGLRREFGFDNVDWYEDDEQTLGVVLSDGRFVEVHLHECAPSLSDSPTCRYSGRVQPSNMVSANRRPQCLGCAAVLVNVGPSTWRHPDDPSPSDRTAP